MTFKPEFIVTPQPPMGAKAYLIERSGLFVLEVGPGTLITDACTHAGAGSMLIMDGVPDGNGYFPDPPAELLTMPPGISEHEFLASYREAFGKRHGRHLLRKSPTVMGSWMLNAGFHNGLTVEVSGGHEGMAPVATIVWQPFRQR